MLCLQEEQIAKYTCQFAGLGEDKKEIKLQFLDEFHRLVFNFLRRRIDEQYPREGIIVDRLSMTGVGNENFMTSLAPMVIGREDEIDQV